MSPYKQNESEHPLTACTQAQAPEEETALKQLTLNPKAKPLQ